MDNIHNLNNLTENELRFLLDSTNYFPITGKDAMFVTIIQAKIVAELESIKK